MSLIRARRDRSQLGYGARRGMSPSRLIILLALVIVALWYLGRL
ncbi:MAG TPA: hypothetical protein VLH75_19470 [Longimicrobiales bacterium]|nr:hypothetical protein [Longimicrobiales bacterium]